MPRSATSRILVAGRVAPEVASALKATGIASGAVIQACLELGLQEPAVLTRARQIEGGEARPGRPKKSVSVS